MNVKGGCESALYVMKKGESCMIHKYQLNGYNLCLDVHSGAVHVLDDITYDILDYCD